MLTITQIEDLFHHFNARYFNCELPTVTIKYCNAKGYNGIFNPRKDKYGRCTIKINRYYDIDDYNVENILIHEMIHLWQYVNNHFDIHGKSFKYMMNIINSQGQHRISIVDRNRYNTVKRTNKVWYIILFKYYGQNSICKFSSLESMYRFSKKMKTNYYGITDMTMYSASHEYLDKITTSVRKLHCYHISSHFLNTEILPNCKKEYIFE